MPAWRPRTCCSRSTRDSACFFGVFDHEPAVKEALGIPVAVRTVGTIALGHEDPENARPSRSSRRDRRRVGDVVHVGRW